MSDQRTHVPNLLDLLDELEPLSPIQREQRLAELPISDDQRQELRRGLQASTRAGASLEQMPALPTLDPSLHPVDVATAAHEQLIGNYRILSVIGEGGMGVVYRAEQQNPRRLVALKLIRPGLASRELLARFALEAQVLGRLQHPGIAQ